jgi:xanthine dehydrogenase accessory factor
VKADLLARLLDARREKRAVVLATTLPTGEQRLLDPRAASDDPLADEARRAAARDACVTVLVGGDPRTPATGVEREGATIFLQPYNPPLRLVLVGAVHIAQPLSQMATLAGFEVTIVDPRTAFSTEARFPGIRRLTTWPDRALAELRPDRRTAVVTLTHDPKLDDPALEVALRSEAFYVGSLGSSKTHASRVARLRERGFGEAEIGRIFGPVGLRIGALSPAEIAVSVLAQIVETLRKAP